MVYCLNLGAEENEKTCIYLHTIEKNLVSFNFLNVYLSNKNVYSLKNFRQREISKCSPRKIDGARKVPELQ